MGSGSQMGSSLMGSNSQMGSSLLMGSGSQKGSLRRTNSSTRRASSASVNAYTEPFMMTETALHSHYATMGRSDRPTSHQHPPAHTTGRQLQTVFPQVG